MTDTASAADSPDIWRWDTATTAARIANGVVSAVEVTEAHLARLDAVNPAVNAVTFDVRDEARAAAAELDNRLAAGRGPVGPLHGVPITIKENIDVHGQPTPNGLPAQADLIGPSDSPFVDNMRRAGAVIIGRTNAPEMSYRWHTDNPLRGETANPWSSNRTAGGSSGGAAAAAALGIGTFAHGNDLGGSVRQPANCCGLAGIRPSLGRVPSHNESAAADRTMALQLMSVQGVLAPTVNDVRLAFDVARQPNPRDPWHRDAPIRAAGDAEGRRLRIAATHGASSSPTDAEVRDAIDTAARHLEASGHVVEFVDPPSFDEIMAGWQSLLATETAAGDLDALFAITSDDFRNIIGWMFTGEALLDLRAYVTAWATRATILRRWTQFLSDWDLVLAPVSQIKPFAPNDDASSADRFREILMAHTPLVAVNYLGLPSVAVPTVMTEDGPIGVQLIGAPFREDLCLDAAADIEARTGVMVEHLRNR